MGNRLWCSGDAAKTFFKVKCKALFIAAAEEALLERDPAKL